jgi:hypothetical protein
LNSGLQRYEFFTNAKNIVSANTGRNGFIPGVYEYVTLNPEKVPTADRKFSKKWG